MQKDHVLCPALSPPLLTVDCVVLDPAGRVLLIKRGKPPFKGQYALPGGFVDQGETVENAARRELREETSIRVRKLQLVGIYSSPNRDPRGHTVSVAFLAIARRTEVKAGDDADAVAWIRPNPRTRLAFDHREIIADALRLAQVQTPAG